MLTQVHQRSPARSTDSGAVQLMPLLILASPALLIWVDVPVIIITAEDALTAAQLINRRYIVIHHGWPASRGSFRGQTGHAAISRRDANAT